MRKTKRALLSGVVLLALLAACVPSSRDPVGVVKQYLGPCPRWGRGKRYALLSKESKKTTTRKEYAERAFHDIVRGISIDTISVLPEDPKLPTYRRVRFVCHYGGRRQSFAPGRIGGEWKWLLEREPKTHRSVAFCTLKREDGRWRIAWEEMLTLRAQHLSSGGLYAGAVST